MDKYERLAKIVVPIIANMPSGDEPRREYNLTIRDDVFKAIAVMNEFEPATDPVGQEAEREALKEFFRPVKERPEVEIPPVEGYGAIGSFIVSDYARSLPEAAVAISVARTMLSVYRITFDPSHDEKVWDEFSNKFQDLILSA